MSVFIPKKMCDYQRGSEYVVTCLDSTACPRTLRGLVGTPGPAVRLVGPALGFIAGPPLLSAQARAIVSTE